MFSEVTLTLKMFLAILAFIVATAIVAIFAWYYKFLSNEKYLLNYKGPRPIVIFGNLLDLGDIKVVLQNALKLRDQFGETVRLWIGSQPRLLICGEELTKRILSSYTLLEKPYEYKFFHAWLGTGLLTSTGAKWRQRRKLLTPAFHFKILEQYIGTFNTQTDTLVERLTKEVNNGSIDIFPYITLCALDIICEAAMGTQVHAQKNSESEYVRSVKEMCMVIRGRAMSPIKNFDAIFALSKDYWKQKRALKVLHGYTDAVIVKRRQELLARNANRRIADTNNDGDGIKPRMALLDLLLQSSIDGMPLSNECIREEVDTFMFEGHDTTTSGISFALYNLSKHPVIQEKVVEEIRGIFGNEKRLHTYQDLQDMKYLELVIKESLRLYPPVPIFSRSVNNNTESDEDIFPKCLSLTIFVLGLHSQPKIFPNPDVFDPDRFLPENSSGRSPFAYVPFSAGPRNCIGQRFAMLEMKSTISKVLRHFELLPVIDHTPILRPEVVLKSANGLPIILKRREF